MMSRMMEVVSTVRPGRPRLLVSLTAGLLLLSLAVAWGQAHLRSSLAPAIALERSPLIVKPPRGWERSEFDDGSAATFRLVVARELRGRRVEFVRRIRFTYEQLPTYVPPLEILKRRFDREIVLQAAPGKIGSLEGIEVSHARSVLHLGKPALKQTLLRLACSPRGDLIIVEYSPLAELTASDHLLFDDVCAAIEFDDPAIHATAADTLNAAGVALDIDPAWSFSMPYTTGVRGLHISGTAGGVPCWSIGVYRTWLQGGRRPQDLLLDLAAHHWLLQQADLQIREGLRGEGGLIIETRHPEPERTWPAIIAASVVVDPDDNVALAYLCAGELGRDQAFEAAERVVATLEMRSASDWIDLSQAASFGSDFAERLQRKGAAPWWGRDSENTRYLGKTPLGPVEVRSHRVPTGRADTPAYEGSRTQRSEDVRLLTRWSLGPNARAYSLEHQFLFAAYPGNQQITIMGEVFEERQKGSSVVRRVVGIGRKQLPPLDFRPPATFIPPPALPVVEFWVANQAESPLLLITSSLIGRETHTRLLWPLEAQAGLHRVLIQRDYWPLGEIRAYDDNAVLQHAIDGEGYLIKQDN